MDSSTASSSEPMSAATTVPVSSEDHDANETAPQTPDESASPAPAAAAKEEEDVEEAAVTATSAAAAGDEVNEAESAGEEPSAAESAYDADVSTEESNAVKNENTASATATPTSTEETSTATVGEKRKDVEAANGTDASAETSSAMKKQKTEEAADAVETAVVASATAPPTPPKTTTAAIKDENDASVPTSPAPTTNTTTTTMPPASATALATAPAAVDTTAVDTAPIMLSRDDMAKIEEDDGVVKFDVIANDGTPEHLVQLTTLKNIFAKQLPKMPKEYIVRLVFDRNHRSMVILKDNSTRVIGGICYRPFEPNGFAEIAFCAINAADQVKGYGTRLMNHLKEYVKRIGITHFLTYADNYAIGYFKKQGFAKVVSMPRPNWFGYIKDYDGGTLMECTLHHQIDYLRITSMVQKQRKAIQDKINERSRAHIVYPGLEKFAEGRLMDIYMIPGVKEAGWSQATIRNSRIGTRDPGSLKTQLTQLWKAVSSHRSAWPFHEPVDTTIVVDYLEYIKDPVDLTLIAKRIESGQYISKAALRADFDRMCANCMVYNTPDTNYYKAAKDLLEFIDRRIPIRDGAATNKP